MQLLKTKARLIALVVIIVLVGLAAAAGIVVAVIGGMLSSTQSPQADCTAPYSTGGNTTSIPKAPAEVRKEQIENAKTIAAVVREMGLPGRAAEIAIVAAMGESSLVNLSYGDEAQGVTNPDGSATTSKGLFQQQTSQGWGTVEQVTNPQYATKSFLLGPKHNGAAGLVAIPNWQDGEITLVIHKVQSNSEAGHYAQFYDAARQIITAAGIDTSQSGDSDGKWTEIEPKDNNAVPVAGSSCESGGGSRSVDAFDADDDYPWIRVTPPPFVYDADPLGFYYGECTSFVAWRMNRDLDVGENGPWKFTNGTGGVRKGNGAEWKGAWEQLGWKISSKPVPGAVAWWGSGGGEGVGSAGHVAYVTDVLEDGKVIIEEYNNSYYSPPGHKYTKRPQAVLVNEINAYLYPPPLD